MVLPSLLVLFVVIVLCLTEPNIIAAIKASCCSSLPAGGTYDCDTHFEIDKDEEGNPTSYTRAFKTHAARWSAALTPDCPPLLSVQLNVTGACRTAADKTLPKSYTIAAVPLQFTAAEVGFSVPDDQPCTYELFTVWCHRGDNFTKGHWFAFVKTLGDQWWEVDMHKVKPVAFKNIPLGYVHFCC